MQVRNSVIVDLSIALPYGELARLYRGIETALPDNPNRVIQFASAYAGEGSGAIAFETAVIAAQMMGKRVLFIDTGMSQVDVSYDFRETIAMPLDTLLLNGRPPYEAIAQAAGTELYLTRLRQRGDNEFPTASLSAMEKVLESLRPLFDLVVIDSQGVMNDAFGIAFAKLADASILVVEAERTRAPVAAECKRMLEAAGGRVIGSALSRRRFYIPKFIYRLFYPSAL
jgi:Mrp family chromosome partitioning ATPase